MLAKSAHQSAPGPSVSTRDPVLLLLGTLMLCGVVLLALYAPTAFDKARFQVQIISAIAGGFLGSALPGFVGLDVRGMRAVGSVSLTVLFFIYSPGDVVDHGVSKTEQSTQPASPVDKLAVPTVPTPTPHAVEDVPPKAGAPSGDIVINNDSPQMTGNHGVQNVTYNKDLARRPAKAPR